MRSSSCPRTRWSRRRSTRTTSPTPGTGTRRSRGSTGFRKCLAAPALRPYLKREKLPGSEVRTDEQIRDYIRKWVKTDYHPVGACKMGVDDMAVVDPELRVHGLEGLRVIDSSIMPNIISGNTQAPSMMIGEKGAAMILAGDVA